MKHRGILWAAVGLLAIVGAIAAGSVARSRPARVQAGAGSPGHEEPVASAPSVSQSATYPPGFHPRTPAYAPSERTALISAARVVEACMHGDGVPDYPVLASSFGDGKTPAPLEGGPTGSDMDPASATFQRATTACASEQATERRATLAANGVDDNAVDDNAVDVKGSSWPPMAPPDFGPIAPTYPAAKRAAVLAAAATVQACMHGNGVPDFPALAGSYGDGRTVGPRLGGPAGSDLDPTTSAYQHGRNACLHHIDDLHRVMLEAAGELP